MNRARPFLLTLLLFGAMLGLCGAYPTGITQTLWATRAITGDQSDGTSGACTVTSGTTTMTRNIYCSTLAVSGGAILATAGYEFSADICNIQGTVENDGVGAPGGTTAGTGAPSGSLNGGTSGGTGATSASSTPQTGGGGTAGGGSTYGNLAGSTSGAGGATRSDGNGGPLALANILGVTYGGARADPFGPLGSVFGAGGNALITGGVGGGGGGAYALISASCSPLPTGGGGGGGGGVVVGHCRWLTGNGFIHANGGDAANGTATTSGTDCEGGGGGGGSGGVVEIFAEDTTNWTGSLAANGGNLGSGHGGAANGNLGFAGTAMLIRE